MLVRDVMSPKVVSIHDGASVKEASETMERHDVGRLPVVDADGVVIGIVTDRDIVVSGVAKGGDYLGGPIKGIMTSSVVTIDHERTVEDALEAMGSAKIRSLLAMHGDRLVGIVTLGDILQTFMYGDKVLETLGMIYG